MHYIDNLSILNIVLQAGLVVKFIILILILSSVFSWTVGLSKLAILRRQVRYIDHFEEIFFSGKVLDKIYDIFSSQKDNIMAVMFSLGMQEFRKISSTSTVLSKDEISEYVVNAMNFGYNSAIRNLESKMEVLANIASVSPFVGLFGTVWGIMNSFQSISFANNTSLTVVAPSIAEALLATAVGLLVAIPALIFYNLISSGINKLSGRLEYFIEDFRIVLTKRRSEF